MDSKHEQTTNEASSRRARNTPKSEPNQAEMKMHKTQDDVLNVIESVELQLGALRSAHEDHRQAMVDLGIRKRAIEDQTQELENREAELTASEVELAEMRQDFESREINLVQRASGLEQRESKIVSQAELLEQHEADLESKDQALGEKIQELDNQLAGISKRKVEIDAIEQEVKEKLAREDESAAKLEIAIKELEESRSSVGQMSDRYETLASELEDLRGQHRQAAEELETAENKLRGREIELGEQSHSLGELAEKVGAVEHELAVTCKKYDGQLAEQGEELANAKAHAQELGAQLETLKDECVELNSESTQRVNELGDQLAGANTEIESMRELAQELSAHSEESDAQIVDLTTQLDESHAQVQALSDQVNEIAQCADEELTAERKRVEELGAEVQARSAELEEANARCTGLKGELESRAEINHEELAALNDQLDQANEAWAEASTKLEASQSALDTLQNEMNTRQEELAESQSQVQALQDQSAELADTIERLNAQLAEAAASFKLENNQWNELRRARLGKMRKRLGSDAEKIRMATEALRSRYDQCEQVLHKRAELAQAYEAIESAQRKYHVKEVRSGVALGLISMAAITLVLAATSWFVSGRVAPGMYAATVTMAAASGDSKLSEAEMEQWEVYITQLVSDPRFVEVAADRMKRRGISEFGVPGELAREMEQSLDVISAMPGTLVMEYRGVGSQRTQRVLDTFSVALSSAANNARARRADSSITMIEEEAQAGTSPLDTRRIEAAGMIFGGGMLLSITLGGVLWRRLSAAKAKFEQDSRIEALFDDEQWEMPT